MTRKLFVKVKMLSLKVFRLQSVSGRLINGCKNNVCILNKSLYPRVFLLRPNSNLASQAAKAESINSKVIQEKDKLLFHYENPRFYAILNAFGFVQFFFWAHLAHFMLTKGEKLKMETNEYSPWWKKLNLEDKTTKTLVTSFIFLVGWGVLSMSWIYTLRSVRMLVLRKDKKTVAVVTYGPFGRERVLDVPLENMTTNVSRKFAKTQLPIKVKGKWFYYTLDMREGKFPNPELFDHTAGMKRALK